jgi:hypothetical protein
MKRIRLSDGLEHGPTFWVSEYWLRCDDDLRTDIGLDWTGLGGCNRHRGAFTVSQASIARDTHLDDFNTENDTCHSSAADNCHFIHCQDQHFGCQAKREL